jgi:hypothetical protein
MTDSTQKRLELAFERFCKTNATLWISRQGSAGVSKAILSEGFFCESGPNYTVRVGTIAKALQEATGGRIDILLQGALEKEPRKIDLWKSFGVDGFVSLRGIFADESWLSKVLISLRAACFFLAAFVYLALGNSKWFFNLSSGGVRFGDLIYDEILKQNEVEPVESKKRFSVRILSIRDLKLFLRAFAYLSVLEKVFKQVNPGYYVATHSQYLSYGLPIRFFRAHGVVTIETTDDFLFINGGPAGKLPKFHTQLRNDITRELKTLSPVDLDARAAASVQVLEKRFSGLLEQIDVKMAYRNKKHYGLEELRLRLGITNQNPIVFVFAHVFSDAPQGNSDGSLFEDYFVWLRETITRASKIEKINWVIKEHPSVKAYGEKGLVEKMVRKYCPDSSCVFVCPHDFSTANVKNIAHAVVTAQGTAGLEFACVGLPVVITSKPFYSGFGFTLEPESRSEYFQMLENLMEIRRPDSDQVRLANIVFASFGKMFLNDNSIIDSVVKDLTWGVEHQKDVAAAYDLVTGRLVSYDPKQSLVYELIMKHFGASSVQTTN